MGRVYTVETLQQYEDAVQTASDLLLSFSTPACTKCRMLAPAVAHQIENAGIPIDLLKIDATVFPELAKQFGVTEVPALVRISRGDSVAQATGILSTQHIAQLIEG